MNREISIVLTCGALLLGGCSSLPSSGPTAAEITDSAKNSNPIGFKILDVTPDVINALAHEPPSSIRFLAKDDGPAAGAIGVGDTLVISVFEAGPGLFSRQAEGSSGQSASGDSGAARITLPNLSVDSEGFITVPYAGTFQIAGLSPEDAARRIEAQFKGKSLQPQVIVNIANRLASSVIVYGDIKTPGRYPLTLARERLLDTIALAGGAIQSANDTIVTLVRQNRSASSRLSEINAETEENLVLVAGDRVELHAQPRTFTVFGATGKVSEMAFEAPQLSLAQGVARAGGPSDSQADPRAVYLFRYESAQVGQLLGLTQPDAPVIYRINLMEPASYFAMQRFAMRDRDMIYIANARTNRLQKALNLFASLVSPAIAGKTAAQ